MMKNMRTLITVHSGGLEVPANTRIYLEKAIAVRPDIIEVDVRRTADGIPVLCHDPVLPGAAIPLSRMDLSLARSFYPDLMTLGEALDICSPHSICLNLDIKEIGVIPAAAEMVQKNSGSVRFIFSGCEAREVEKLYSVFPGARVLFNARPWDPSVFPEYNLYVRTVMEEAEALHCFGLNISSDDLKPELMGYSRLFDLPVFVWTVDDRETMKDLILLGVYSITTNNVNLLREVAVNLSVEIRRLDDTGWVCG